MTQSRLLKFARSDEGSLRLNRKHQDAAAHALSIYRSKAIYTFIPKNACSTMRLSLAIANGCIPDASGFAWIHENNETFRANLADLILAEYTFVILRDPYARLASCFLDKIASQARPARRLQDLVAKDLDLDAITFADFVGFLNDADVRADNIHWRPQTDFLVYDCYDDYLAVERFEEATETLRERARIDIVDARPLTTHGLDHYHLLSASLDHSRTPVSEIARLKANGECPDPRSLFTKPIVDAVARLYADDLHLYAEKIGLSTWFTAIQSTGCNSRA